jgi:hypothetical protein
MSRRITLRDKIDNGEQLTEEQISNLVTLFGKGCHAKTKDRLSTMLSFVPHVLPYGIYHRVIVEPKVSYIAGQSYPDEIKFVRHLITHG